MSLDFHVDSMDLDRFNNVFTKSLNNFMSHVKPSRRVPRSAFVDNGVISALTFAQ